MKRTMLFFSMPFRLRADITSPTLWSSLDTIAEEDKKIDNSRNGETVSTHRRKSVSQGLWCGWIWLSLRQEPEMVYPDCPCEVPSEPGTWTSGLQSCDLLWAWPPPRWRDLLNIYPQYPKRRTCFVSCQNLSLSCQTAGMERFKPTAFKWYRKVHEETHSGMNFVAVIIL